VRCFVGRGVTIIDSDHHCEMGFDWNSYRILCRDLYCKGCAAENIFFPNYDGQLWQMSHYSLMHFSMLCSCTLSCLLGDRSQSCGSVNKNQEQS